MEASISNQCQWEPVLVISTSGHHQCHSSKSINASGSQCSSSVPVVITSATHQRVSMPVGASGSHQYQSSSPVPLIKDYQCQWEPLPVIKEYQCQSSKIAGGGRYQSSISVRATSPVEELGLLSIADHLSLLPSLKLSDFLSVCLFVR